MSFSVFFFFFSHISHTDCCCCGFFRVAKSARESAKAQEFCAQSDGKRSAKNCSIIAEALNPIDRDKRNKQIKKSSCNRTGGKRRAG